MMTSSAAAPPPPAAAAAVSTSLRAAAIKELCAQFRRTGSVQAALQSAERTEAAAYAKFSDNRHGYMTAIGGHINRTRKELLQTLQQKVAEVKRQRDVDIVDAAQRKGVDVTARVRSKHDKQLFELNRILGQVAASASASSLFTSAATSTTSTTTSTSTGRQSKYVSTLKRLLQDATLRVAALPKNSPNVPVMVAHCNAIRDALVHASRPEWQAKEKQMHSVIQAYQRTRTMLINHGAGAGAGAGAGVAQQSTTTAAALTTLDGFMHQLLQCDNNTFNASRAIVQAVRAVRQNPESLASRKELLSILEKEISSLKADGITVFKASPRPGTSASDAPYMFQCRLEALPWMPMLIVAIAHDYPRVPPTISMTQDSTTGRLTVEKLLELREKFRAQHNGTTTTTTTASSADDGGGGGVTTMKDLVHYYIKFLADEWPNSQFRDALAHIKPIAATAATAAATQR